MLKVFISSVQKELAAERRAVKDFLTHDPLLRLFVGDVFLFEDIPASDRRADDLYLAEVARADIYVAIFGNDYYRLAKRAINGQNGQACSSPNGHETGKTGRRRVVLDRQTTQK